MRFIDIDWGGLDGEVRYPVFINHRASWPVPDPTDQLIRQDHDRVMLRASLFGSKVMRSQGRVNVIANGRPCAFSHLRPKVAIQRSSMRMARPR